MPKGKLSRKKLEELKTLTRVHSEWSSTYRPDPDHPGFGIVTTTVARFKIDKKTGKLKRIFPFKSNRKIPVANPAYKSAPLRIGIAQMFDTFKCSRLCTLGKKCPAAKRGRK